MSDTQIPNDDILSKKDDIEKSIEIEKETCSVAHTTHTLHTLHSNEKREPINIRLRKSIHEVVMRYCSLTDMTAGEFYEEASMLFMDLYPPPNNLVIVEKNPSRVAKSDRAREILCIRELEKYKKVLRNMTKNNKTIPTKTLQTLDKLFRKAEGLSNPSEELIKLVKEVDMYLE